MGFLFGDGAFVGPGLDLVEQDVARPTEAGGGAEIPEPGSRVAHTEQRIRMVTPRHHGNHFSHKL